MTLTVPPPAPCTMRDRKRKNIGCGSDSAKAKMMYAITDAPSPTSSAGRLPYASENRPHIGALMSWATANELTSVPTTSPPAPSDLA